MKVGILGASGYTGAELLRLLAGHPSLEVAVVTAHSHAGEPVAGHTPSLAAAYPGLVYEENDPGRLDGLDLVFCALPHGESQRVVPELRSRVGLVVDLAADFRLRDASQYPRWYGAAHGAPDLLAEAAYGLPELFRDDLVGATLVAAAGCYPTAAGLALAPLRAAGPGGADRDHRRRRVGRLGRRPWPEGVAPLRDGGRGLHRLRAADAPPHARDGADPRVTGAVHPPPRPHGARHPGHLLRRAPKRGSPHRRPTRVMGALHEAYDDEPFVVVRDDPPSTKATAGSNAAHVTARVDPRTGWVVTLCALDNLVKGASGQAIQCANAALGLPETTGLPVAGVYP